VNQHLKFKFRLYVAGGTPNSVQAVANLKSICRAHLPDRHEIEIVDVFREPKRALADGIYMTPMLVKLAPAPVQTILGTLSQTEALLQALELETFAA
jgi:circadian clock protein KaiB